MKMTTHILTRTCLALLAASSLAAGAEAETKIAVIDLKRVFENYWKTKQANAQLDEQKADIKKRTQAMADDYAKANEDYKKLIESTSDQAVSSEERDKRKNAAEKKLVEIRQIEQDAKLFQSNSEESLALQIRRLRDRILGDIRDLVDARAKAGGYTMVINVAAESSDHVPVLLYSNGQNDLTEEILAQLNAGAPSGLQKPDESKEKPGDKKEEGKK